MQSYRLIPTTTLLRTVSKPQAAKDMACYYATTPRASSRRYHNLSPFFPRSSPFVDIASTVQPFFKLLDEELSQLPRSQPLRSFQPRFDVKEGDAAFHLQGELPGIDQENINIEFKDENTLVISGRSVRESAQTSEEAKGKAVEASEPAETTNDAASETGSHYHKPSVEEEFVDVASETQPADTPATTATEVAKPEAETAPVKEQPASKFWVNERSVGEFRRTFTFSGHIDQEAVTANLNNGILNITVPKVAPKEPKRITIQ